MRLRPDKEAELKPLRPFQRRTVDHVVRQLLTPGGSRRFLVADEVGLGKTLVARGVIAEFVDRNWDAVERIDIVYMCSNSALARSNVSKLSIGGKQANIIPATRFTLLPAQLNQLKGSKLNFISITPDTAMKVQGGGWVFERQILYQMMRQSYEGMWLSNLLRDAVGAERWRAMTRDQLELDPQLCGDFLKALQADRKLSNELEAMREPFGRVNSVAGKALGSEQYRLIGSLRALLARTCIGAVQPDLIILDEFQRFKDLLTVEGSEREITPVAELAQQLFEYTTPENVPVALLLLSATPYRMFTTAEESATDDHYSDFLETVRFLMRSASKFDLIKATLRSYREHLHRAAQGHEHDLDRIRETLTHQLLTVMVRTERVRSTQERDAMVCEPDLKAPIDAADLGQYLGVEGVREELRGRDMVDLWKSAPYLLNFMKTYEIKQAFNDKLHLKGIQEQVQKHLVRHLSQKQLKAYQRVDPANSRLRLLEQACLGNEQWRTLWLAPSHAYWPLEDPWIKNADFTKKLIFSSWNVVPDAISSLLSFEAERLQVSAASKEVPEYQDLHTKRRGLLRYAVDGDAPNAMTTLALQVPCLSLSDIHPLSFPDGCDVRAEMRDRVRSLLADTHLQVGDGAGDPKWYWAALLHVDSDRTELRTFLEGLKQDEQADAGGPEDAESTERRSKKGLARHIDEALAFLDGKLGLGAAPHDLAEVLADFALGSPSVLWARTLGGFGIPSDVKRAQAATVADAFRGLFNEPAVVSMLQESETSYWRKTLHYAVQGNLQAVLDEYAHLLWEQEVWEGASPNERAASISKQVAEAVTLKSSRVRPDYYERDGDRIAAAKSGTAVRTHFALRYGKIASSGDAGAIREDAVRDAFKSPFYPFVIASTSVGQEGLDFHPWCHAVWHWNLPGNPVDLEQREGRVHRYKGHAVRKNVAHQFGSQLRAQWTAGRDPWEVLFDLAASARPKHESELIPCWLAHGPHKVQRCVPLLPFSREHEQLNNLKRSLAIYRVVFGQPRQEELLRLLSKGSATQEELDRWVVRLEPN